MKAPDKKNEDDMEQLKEACRKQTTEEILSAIIAIGGSSKITTDVRMVRAALIDVYAERTSIDEADALMDTIGM